VRFTVLGSGTSVPDPVRGPAGFLLQVGARAFWVDGGSGALQRTARAGVDPRTLDGGFYSHFHPDHCADLVPLLFSMRVGPPRRERDYPIWAGEGFGAFFSGLQQAYGRWIHPGGLVVIHELPLDARATVDLGDLVVHTAPAVHAASALHLRFEADGDVVVFSGDTGPSDALAELAAGADLLVCECAGSDEEPVPEHLTPTDVREIVARARPREVWLTHFYPQVDPARALATVGATGVPVRPAADLDRWER
jgi:ribonuclease BN (tRNA processing enzyme)